MITIEQLEQLLDRYFVGPFERVKLEKLLAEMVAIETDPGKRVGEETALRSNGKRHFGELWKEQRDEPRQVELWIAASRGGYLTARPYCPRELVGTWTQVEPGQARWTFGADGALETTDATFAASKRWCVHRTNEEAGPDGDELWVSPERSSDFQALYIDQVTASELDLTWIAIRGDVSYRLRRS